MLDGDPYYPTDLRFTVALSLALASIAPNWFGSDRRIKAVFIHIYCTADYRVNRHQSLTNSRFAAIPE